MSSSCIEPERSTTNIIAIGGFSGVAIGLAGRQLAESFLAGIVMFASAPFEKGESISFKAAGMDVTGNILDIGFLKTTVRSERREIFTVPNAKFMSGVILNRSRKYTERLMSTHMNVRPVHGAMMDVAPVEASVRAIRRRVQADPNVIATLPVRVHLREITLEGYVVKIHCYIRAQTHDDFLDFQQAVLEDAARIFTDNGVMFVWSEPEIV